MRQEKLKERNRAAITLALLCGVVVIASVFTVKSSIDKVNNTNMQNNLASQYYQPVNQQIPTVDSRSSNEAREDSGGNTTALSDFGVPVKGELLSKFSPDAPVYSKTLDQYMTHFGVDIAAPLDAQVKAVAAGTVTDVRNDNTMGITIEITHEDGFKSIYSNLSVTSMVEVGDVIDKGQVISGVGNTSLFESLEASHIHFELIKDNVHVNPEDFIIFS